MLSLLRMRLHQAVDCQSAFTAVAAAEAVPITPLEGSSVERIVQVIPIKRVSTRSFVYVCAIAHRLATPSQPVPMIAAGLVNTMQAHSDSLSVLSGIVVQATATGWLQFELGDRAIATWLDLLLANALPSPCLPIAATEPQVRLPAAAIFAVQYAHARCCSLLRLAHREALITLDRLNEAPFYWRVASPPSIPWLTSTDQLCLDHPADRSLLGHLVEALDRLSDDSPQRTQRILRSAQAIAQAMQVCHRLHPLWRKTGRTGANRDLVVAQLGLLIATQRILHFLLWDGLHLCPAVEF